MKLLLTIAALMLSILGSVFDQTGAGGCPKVILHGPQGVIQPGKLLGFRVEVESNLREPELEYKWTVRNGQIASGQGTAQIEVALADGSHDLLVTIQVQGLPKDCHNTASEMASWEPQPEAKRVGVFDKLGSDTDGQLALIGKAEAEYPLNRLVVFLKTSRQHPSISIIHQRILTALVGGGLDSSRVTFIVNRENGESIKIWRVPPGAADPSCTDCEPLKNLKSIAECPTITILGPAGITNPGDVMTFSASISGHGLSGFVPVWTAVGGKIVKGQGTLEVDVRPPSTVPFSVTATVRILGLPAGCTSVATETGGVVD
jgi:hypothetical protein